MKIRVPKALATATTDANGNFRMSVPGAEPFVVFAQAWRSYGSGRYLHRYWWIIRSADIKEDLIMNQPQKRGPTEGDVTLDIATE